MNKLTQLFCLGLVSVLVTVDWGRAQTTPDMVSELERGEVDSARLEGILTNLAETADAGRPVPWDRLVEVVANAERHGKIRRRVFELILNDAPSDWRVRASERLALAVKSTPADLETETLSGMLLRWFSEQPPEDLAAHRAFLETLVGLANVPLERRQLLFEAVGRIPNSVAWKSHLAGRLIVDHGRTGNFSGSPLVDALKEEEFVRLREVVRLAPAQADLFHFGAASALADQGDLMTVDLLRAKAREGDRAVASSALQFVEMIELQHPPTKLVAWATEDSEERRPARKRAWALERALELGVSKEALRTAILEYAEVVKPRIEAARKAKGAMGAGVAASALLGPIKRTGLELEALQPGDLEHVQLEEDSSAP